MKKRIFIPISIGFIIINILLWGITLLGISMLIWDIIDPPENGRSLLIYLLVGLGILFMLYSSIRFLIGLKINLREKDVYTFGDLMFKFEKIQYKCSINYNTIKNISIIASTKNSKNQQIPVRGISISMPTKYMEFELLGEKKERIAINYYTKKQVIKMLKYINNNMQVAGNENILNIEEIMKDWYSYGGYNREDLKLKRGELVKKKSKSQSETGDLHKEDTTISQNTEETNISSNKEKDND